MSSRAINTQLCGNYNPIDSPISKKLMCSIHRDTPQVESAAAAAVPGGYWGYYLNNNHNFRTEALDLHVGRTASRSYLKLKPGFKVYLSDISTGKIARTGAIVGAVLAAPFEIYEHYSAWKNKEQTGVQAIIEATVDVSISSAAAAAGSLVGVKVAAGITSIIVGIPLTGATVGLITGAAVGWSMAYLLHEVKNSIITDHEAKELDIGATTAVAG